jgi:hypothetical protein
MVCRSGWPPTSERNRVVLTREAAVDVGVKISRVRVAERALTSFGLTIQIAQTLCVLQELRDHRVPRIKALRVFEFVNRMFVEFGA